MLKIAYQHGFEMALEEAGMTKEALLGRILLNAGKYIGKGLLGTGKVLWRGGKGLYSGAAHLVPGGKGTLSYALISSGLGGLTAEPGHRLEGMAKGFGSGLIGGLGWHYSDKLMSGILKRIAGSRFVAGKLPGLSQKMFRVMGKGKTPGLTFREIFSGQHIAPGEAAKLLGAKTLTSGLGFAAAMGGSVGAENLAHKYVPFLREEMPQSYRDIPRYVNVAREVLRAPRIGVTPPGGFPGAYPGMVPGSQTW